MTTSLVPRSVPAALRESWHLTLEANAQALVERAMAEDFDLVLLHADLPGNRTVATAKAAADLLFRTGCSAPMLRLDDHPTPCEPPFRANLALPLTSAAMAPHITHAVGRRRALSHQIGSHLKDHALAELSAAFRAQLPETLARLADAARCRDLSTLGSINHVLKGIGTTHGLPQLTQRGAEIAALLEARRHDDAIERTLALVACVTADLQRGPST
jgi:hypothetical protein